MSQNIFSLSVSFFHGLRPDLKDLEKWHRFKPFSLHRTHTTWFSSAIVHVFFEAKQLSQVWLQANVLSAFLANRFGESSSVSHPSKSLIPHPNLGSVGCCQGVQSGIFSFLRHFPFTVDWNGPLQSCESHCSLFLPFVLSKTLEVVAWLPLFSIKSITFCGEPHKFCWHDQ